MKVWATNTDISTAGAMIPVLELLRSKGHEVITLAEPASRGFAAFSGGGFEPVPFEPFPNYDDAMKALLEKQKPEVIIVGIASGDQGTEKSVLKIGPKLGIPVVALVDTWPNDWLYWYVDRNDRGEVALYNRARAICVPDDLAIETMIKYGFDKAKLFATGNPEWDLLAKFRSERDKYRKEMRGKWGIGEDKFVMLFATTSKLDDPDQDKPGAVGWFGTSEKDIIRECLRAIQHNSSVHLVIRQKPGWSTETITKLMTEIPCGAVLDTEPYERGWPSVLAVDVVVGLATLVLQNAAILGVPAISYQPGRDPKEDSFSPNKIGITVSIYEHGVLEKLICDARQKSKEQFLTELQARAKRIELVHNATERRYSLIIGMCK